MIQSHNYLVTLSKQVKQKMKQDKWLKGREEYNQGVTSNRDKCFGFFLFFFSRKHTCFKSADSC